MNYDLRESLAGEFAETIRTIREKRWKAFKAATKETSLDPYVALSRLLVRIVEEALDGPRSGNGRA